MRRRAFATDNHGRTNGSRSPRSSYIRQDARWRLAGSDFRRTKRRYGLRRAVVVPLSSVNHLQPLSSPASFPRLTRLGQPSLGLPSRADLAYFPSVVEKQSVLFSFRPSVLVLTPVPSPPGPLLIRARSLLQTPQSCPQVTPQFSPDNGVDRENNPPRPEAGPGTSTCSSRIHASNIPHVPCTNIVN